jgi:hypothetical protein
MYIGILFAAGYGEQLSRYVVLVIVDGARYSETLGDRTARYIPRMKNIADEGVVVDSMINDGFTYTSRAVPAIWTGSWAPIYDTTVTLSAFGTLNTQYTTVPSVWEYYRKSVTTSETQAIYCLKYLSTPWLPSFHKDYGPNYWPLYVLAGKNDREVWVNAKSQLQNYHPALSVIYLADVDHYGHSGVWENYTTAIMIADSIIGAIWDFLQNDRYFKDNTTLLVTNDHGRHLDGVSTGFKGHGDDCWGCRHIMMLGIGPAVKSGGMRISHPYYLPDITPTIGRILDFETPLVSGMVMTEFLEIPEEKINDVPRPGTFQIAIKNYPNPFNSSTSITYELSLNSKVSLSVYNLTGDLVETLVDEVQTAGCKTVIWKGQNKAAGLYFFRLGVDGISKTSKGLLLK